MKSLLALLLTAGFAGAANAHVLDEHRNLFEQIGHQLLGSHHLPSLLLIVLAVWLVIRVARRHNS